MKLLAYFIFKISIALILFSSSILCEDISLADDDIKSADLQIIGKILTTEEGKDFFAFRGIPYAKPPIGERRFKDPEPYGEWEGLLDARKDRNLCPQNMYNEFNLTMSEDCLTLNVYTKSLEDNKPVLVYIHGGGFKYGTGNSLIYNPKYLLDEDIVFVIFNYRLGPFGFLSTDSKEATGNFGFKDQVLVLKWVRDNIKGFGGNPDLITLIGHSAGAISATLHMASPMSKNLFHRVIALSASSTHHWKGQNSHLTQTLAESVNCPVNDSKELVECLRKKPWEDIIEACSKWDENGLADLEWNVELEKDFGQEQFINENPSVLYRNGNFFKIPVIIGTTRDEFADQGHKIILDTYLLNEFNENFNKVAPNCLGYNYSDVEESKTISERLRDFYFKDQRIGVVTETNLSNLFSDALINHGVHRFVQLASQHIDVYFYRFDYKGRYTCSYSKSYGEPFYVYHGDILFYLFVYPYCAPEFKKEDPEYLVMKKFIKFLKNFAQSGNPNGDKSKDDESYWTPSTKENIKTYYINEISKVDEPPYQDRLTLWDELFPIKENN
ncbi:juvenile hormone esterase-like [Condylostylus longicornis]|uniref:juvenile hormone esterase-like n=1 Tax=Condylostylus longicornis TaxID=2530218 RepID=UPI00244DD875|nr:juvenile hormone esterase-like [Condylostylus longicornis]